ncbi:MAG: endonuclease III [Desulfobacterales bacterium]|nr:endonuclease III [Desulfobacterales bacterium]
MNKKTKIKQVIKNLKEMFPEVQTQLNYNNPFELLVATILSAQCTDKQVNNVTKKLFQRFKTPYDFAEGSIEELESLIKQTGYFHNKAKNIKECAKTVIEKFNGNVPDNMDDLLTLRGVGRKTANVVLNVIFNKGGIVVDTHVLRISRRLGFTDKKDPNKVEFDLMEIIPKNECIDFSLRLIYFGRSICKAIKPKCNECNFFDICIYEKK